MNGLPDYLSPGLDVVFVGMNPGLLSAKRGHYYARRGNHFWRLLCASGFVPEGTTHENDHRVNEWGLGLTDLAARPTNAAHELDRDEIAAGRRRLAVKLRRCAPRAICFNGKVVYEGFTGERVRSFGLQDERVGRALAFVVPSSSPRVTTHSFDDRLVYFQELRRLLQDGAKEARAS